MREGRYLYSRYLQNHLDEYTGVVVKRNNHDFVENWPLKRTVSKYRKTGIMTWEGYTYLIL